MNIHTNIFLDVFSSVQLIILRVNKKEVMHNTKINEKLFWNTLKLFFPFLLTKFDESWIKRQGTIENEGSKCDINCHCLKYEIVLNGVFSSFYLLWNTSHRISLLSLWCKFVFFLLSINQHKCVHYIFFLFRD